MLWVTNDCNIVMILLKLYRLSPFLIFFFLLFYSVSNVLIFFFFQTVEKQNCTVQREFIPPFLLEQLFQSYG